MTVAVAARELDLVEMRRAIAMRAAGSARWRLFYEMSATKIVGAKEKHGMRATPIGEEPGWPFAARSLHGRISPT